MSVGTPPWTSILVTRRVQEPVESHGDSEVRSRDTTPIRVTSRLCIHLDGVDSLTKSLKKKTKSVSE